MKSYNAETASLRIAEANCQLRRRKFEQMLGKPIAKHQWLSLKQAMIEAGLDINDDEKLKIVAQIKAGGALTKTNAVILTQVMKWLMDLERFMMQANPSHRGGSWTKYRGAIIWSLQDIIIRDRIAAGELVKPPADSARYNWFHICCPDRNRGFNHKGELVREGYNENREYTRDETYALIIKAATFVNKLKKPTKSADPEAGGTVALASR